MIKVLVKDNEINISGHALYDDYGKDIVCSACSSIVITSINAILSLDSTSIVYNVDKDNVLITIVKDIETTNKLIQNMINLLRELQEQYPKNIEVK